MGGGGLFEEVGGAYGLLDGWSVKVLTLLALLAVTGGLVLRSPLAWLLLPTLAWRFTSSVPSHWEPGLHYSAVLVPIAWSSAVWHRAATASLSGYGSPRTSAVTSATAASKASVTTCSSS